MRATTKTPASPSPGRCSLGHKAQAVIVGNRCEWGCLACGCLVDGRPRKYLRVPPELVDGQHTTVAGPDENAMPQAMDWLASWWNENAEVGDTITLEVVEMTDAEYEAIPEC